MPPARKWADDLVRRQRNAGLDRRDARPDDKVVGNAPQAHADQVHDAHGCAVEAGLEPGANVGNEDSDDNQADDDPSGMSDDEGNIRHGIL